MTLLSVDKVVPSPVPVVIVFPRQLLLTEKCSITGKLGSSDVKSKPHKLWPSRMTAILDDHAHGQFGINE